MVLHGLPGAEREMEERELQSGHPCENNSRVESSESKSAQGFQARCQVVFVDKRHLPARHSPWATTGEPGSAFLPALPQALPDKRFLPLLDVDCLRRRLTGMLRF